MPSSEALDQVAALLPDSHREKFLLMAARFRNVPEDDEYLQILEAIGFMTLLWKEVPREVQSILEGANPVTETCQSLEKYVRYAVNDAIPSHEDLRQITQSLQEHSLSLKQVVHAIGAGAGQKSRNSLFHLFVAFLLGVLICFFGLKATAAGKDLYFFTPQHSDQ